MIAAVEMRVVKFPESLGLSVLGMVIVFIVLIFLMVIIYVMTAIIKKISSRPTTVIGSAEVPPEPLPHVDTTFITSVPATPVLEASVETVSVHAEPATAPDPDSEFFAVKKYRVIVDGVEYEVDADMEDTDYQSDTGRGY